MLVLVVVVWFVLERKIVLVAMCSLQNITSILTQSKKHTLRSFRAIETAEKLQVVDQLTKSLQSQEKSVRNRKGSFV